MKKDIGVYKRRNNCRVCGGKEIFSFIDFGAMPLAGDFRPKEMLVNTKFYPMDLAVCLECSLVQIPNVVSSEIIFSDYRYLSSITKTLMQHFNSYAKLLKNSVLPEKLPFVVEFGCNDGILLKPLKELGIKALGVDAAENIVGIAREKGLDVVQGYFGSIVAKDILCSHGKADVITASNVFAHINDIHEVMEGVKVLLADEGVFIVEVHYIGDLLEDFQFDTVYHEHLCYYSLTAIQYLFEKHGLIITNVQKLPMHGGAIRVFSKRITSNETKVNPRVVEMLKLEAQWGLKEKSTYIEFGKNVIKYREELQLVIKNRIESGRTICAYGAAGRATILLNYCGFDSHIIDYIVDESPSRIGRYVPGVNIPILDRETFSKKPSDDCLITAWNYQDEIIEKENNFISAGGVFIVPLPKIEFIQE
jgi:SAM-dependent methyltransferase